MRIGINGAGVAGPTLAYWLRRYGHQPVLFERAPVPRAGGYLIDFWGLGYRIAERMGVLPALQARGYEMQRLRLVNADGREIAGMDFEPIRQALDGRFISLSRAALAGVLLEACEGIPVHFGVSVTDLKQDQDGVTATLSDGRQERFDLVVGTDGLHSRVRELTFGPEQRFERFLGCHVAAFRTRGYSHRDELVYASHTVPGRQAARVSLRDDETLVLLVCRSELLSESLLGEDRKEALCRAFGRMGWEVPELLERLRATDDLYVDRVSQIRLPHWSSGRIVLAGDAAACPSLLSGEGSGLGMVEAYVLAGELARADGDVTAAFARYEQRLAGFVSRKQKSAIPLRGFFAPAGRMGLAFRNLAVKLMAVPGLGRLLLARSLRDDLELPDYSAG